MVGIPASRPSRRMVLRTLAGAGAAAVAGIPASPAASEIPLSRAIPSSGETIPVIGMGSWITFNVGDDAGLRDKRKDVLQTFFDMGGGVIDSSPMYGSSEAVIGAGLGRIARKDRLFAATKVWTPLTALGRRQMAESRRLWGLERFDLMQIHNLLNWEGHLPELLEDKAAGRIRYLGITTSHGRRHQEMEAVMARQPLDFVQFTYNIADREAEQRLLPLATERGLAVCINRPFGGGALFQSFARHPLPAWANEIDCANWAQVFLKFVVSHPGVTCAIPATSRVDHMAENMGALRGRLPDEALRRRMVHDLERL